MIPANKQVLQAFAILSRENAFHTVMDWLKASLAKCDEDNRIQLDDRLFRRGQGESICLSAIIEAQQKSTQR